MPSYINKKKCTLPLLGGMVAMIHQIGPIVHELLRQYQRDKLSTKSPS